VKFLVILITVVITYFWQQDLDQIDDRWFFALRRRIESMVNRLALFKSSGWFIIFALTFIVPLSVLALLLWFSNDVLFGLTSLLIHLFVLLMAFDRIHPGLLAKRFLDYCGQGDYEACYLFLEREMECSSMPEAGNKGELQETFGRLYVYRCFEKMFVTFFWYLVAGPLGVMLAYICYQLRGEVLFGRESPEAESVAGLIMVLEWLPLRLLGVTFCLMGNFEACFSRLRRSGLVNQTATDQTVYEYALCALDSELGEGSVNSQGALSAEAAQPVDVGAQMAARIHSLKGLMDRSQFTWLSAIAFITVLGWQF